MTVSISFDLETWGKRAGCDLRSIGAVVFNPHIGHVSPAGSPGAFYVALENPVIGTVPRLPDGSVTNAGLRRIGSRKYALTRDPETVQWWGEQSPEAQAAFSNPVDLLDGLQMFSEWLKTMCSDPRDLRMWSHGSAFDAPILEAAYHAVGLPVPWHYRSPRDTRTAFDMAGIEDHSAHLTACTTGAEVWHHALHDAIVQARAVVIAHEA